MAFFTRSLINSRNLLILLQQNSKTIVKTRNIHRFVAPTLMELKRRRDKIGPEPLKPRSTFLEWNYEAEVFAFGKRLNEEFDRNLLKQALTTRSYVQQQQQQTDNDNNEETALTTIEDNSEMIKIGEEIINNCLNEEFTKLYPNIIVKSIEKYLTSEEMLAHVAFHLGLKDIILTAEFPIETTTLSNTFKAIICALNQSTNIERTNLFLKDFLISQLNGKDIYSDEIWKIDNPYEHLLTLINDNKIEARLCNQSAINTILANYQIGLYQNRELLGIGWGESIELAKETAALNAIQKIYKKQFNNYF